MLTWIRILPSNRSSRRPKVACWLSELPTARTTSASRNAFQALEWPLSENTPTASGWRLGDDALAVQGGDERDLEPLDEMPHGRLGVAADRAEAGEQRRPGGRPASASASAAAIASTRCGVGPDRGHVEPDVAVVLDLDAAMGEVLRHVDVHGPGPALEREVDGLLDDVAGVVDVGEQVGLLGRRREHRLGVGRAVQARRVVDRSAALPLERRRSR